MSIDGLGADHVTPDITGVDNGRDKIDVYVKDPPDQLVQPFLDELDSLEFANLALDLLGYDALPGSTFNAAQDLRIG